MNSIIAEKVYENQEQNNTILKFFKKFSIGEAMLQSSFYKAKGATPAELLKYLIGIVFRHTNIYLDTKYRKQPEMSKNTIYRFLSSTLYDWCKLLYLVAMNVIAFIMLKSMYRVYYTYKGQDYTLNDLFREAPRNRRHSAVISSIIRKNS